MCEARRYKFVSILTGTGMASTDKAALFSFRLRDSSERHVNIHVTPPTHSERQTLWFFIDQMKARSLTFPTVGVDGIGHAPMNLMNLRCFEAQY